MAIKVYVCNRINMQESGGKLDMKKTKIIAMVLGLATTITMMIPNDVTRASVQSVPSGYTPIYTIEDLYGINDNLNGNYILMNDIDLSETKQGGEWDSGSGWTPIGTSGDDKEYFTGIFDGNGYRIENMTIYGKDIPGTVGLFGAVSGTVKNLALTDIDISCIESGGECGGIAAWIGGEVDSCYVSGKIESKNLNLIGGIGADERGNGASVTNCYTDVDIINGNRAKLVGGIVALNYNGDVKNCYSIGNIETSEVESDYSYNEEEKVGAITGYDSYEGSCYSKNCYYLSGHDKKAKRLSKAQMKSQNCFTGFDFKKTWVIDKNSSYPYPQLRNCMQVRTESIELLSAPDKLEYTTADKLDLTGSELKINYEDDYSVTVPLEESMLSYKMQEGDQTVRVDYNGCKTSFDIKVKKVKESLKITAKKTKLKIGNVYTYKVKYVGNGNVKYSSSNNNVLSIDKNTGKAKARKAGKATITIKAGKITKMIKVIVKK